MDSLLKTNRKTTFRNLVILFLAAALIVMPIFVWGVPNGSDSTQHYQFALTIYDSLQNGNFYPSLASTTNHGFGDVGIRFYPPFAYYVMAGFRCLTGNWYDASVLSFLLWFFLGGVGVYLWCREWFSENAALTAGIVYIYLPYFAHQIYDSFMYASFAGSALLPFCLLFVTRLFRTNDVKDAFGLTFFYALLIITHLPLTVIGSLSLLVYSLVLFNRENFFSRLLKLSSAVCLAVLATAFYWSRMATELDFVKHTTEYFTVDVYDYRGNFLASFLNSFLYGADYGSYSYGNLLFLLIAVACLPFVAVFYIWSKDKTDRSFTGVAVLLAFSIFISTPLSLFVWERFSLLQKVQFPWRWMTVISITGAVFVAAAFNSLKDLYHTKHRPIVLVTVGLLMIGMIFTSTRLLSSPMQMPRQDFIEQTKYLLNARSYECWWSRSAKKEAVQNSQEVSIANRSAQIIDWQPTRKEITVSAGNPADVRFAVFYYPHWHATVNGQPAETKFDEYGALLVAVPSESADVKIQFEEPSFVILAYRVSLFTWLFLAIIGIFIFRRSAATVVQNARSDSDSLKSFS